MNTHKALYKYTAVLALVTALLLSIPLIAMQFTEEVSWTLSDFIVMGALILGTGLTYKLITRKSGETVYRIAVGLALATGFFLIWSNLAVGIVGSEDNPINLLYFLVLGIGIISAFIARFKSRGMALSLFATAAAQVLVTAIVLIGEFYQTPPSTVTHILGINGFFIMLFVTSGMIFKYAADEESKQESG